jgi:CRISPR-associated protein Csc1
MFISVCHLTLHDYVFYASREMGRLYETERHLHNYGLTYALGLVKSPFASLDHVPRYQEDLAVLNAQDVYVTPAYPLHYTFAFHTFKMASVNYYQFTPQISSNQVVFGRAKELEPASTFEFFVLGQQSVILPRWIRLGKWMAKACLEVTETIRAQQKQGGFQANGALNPLDTPIRPESCNIVAMAPASLVTDASYTGSYYEIACGNGRLIRLPAGMRYLSAYQTV